MPQREHMSDRDTSRASTTGSSRIPEGRPAEPDAGGRSAPEDFSPELALVSPELAVGARLRMSDRPWEEAFPEAEHTGVDVPREQPRRRGRSFSSSLRARAAIRLSRRRTSGLVLLAVVVAGIFVASRTDLLTNDGRDGPAANPLAPDPASTADASTLIPNAGYVVSPSGSFLTASSGGEIAFFTLPLRCGPDPLVIEDIPVSAGAIRFAGKATSGVDVNLSARVLDSRRVRGIVSATGQQCNAGQLKFFARLS